MQRFNDFEYKDRDEIIDLFDEHGANVLDDDRYEEMYQFTLDIVSDLRDMGLFTMPKPMLALACVDRYDHFKNRLHNGAGANICLNRNALFSSPRHRRRSLLVLSYEAYEHYGPLGYELIVKHELAHAHAYYTDGFDATKENGHVFESNLDKFDTHKYSDDIANIAGLRDYIDM